MKITTLFRALKSPKIRWQRVLEDSRVFRSVCNRLILGLSDKLTKEKCIGTYLFGVSVFRLVRKSGFLFTALYLKQCRTLLLKYWAEDRTYVHDKHGISLNGSGLPRIIPSFHRKKLVRGTEDGDDILQLYLSLFALSKLVELAPKISKNTFSSISEGSKMSTKVASELLTKAEEVVLRYIPDIGTIPLDEGCEPYLTSKSTPCWDYVKRTLIKGDPLVFRKITKCRSLYLSIAQEFAAFLVHYGWSTWALMSKLMFHNKGSVTDTSVIALFESRTYFALDVGASHPHPFHRYADAVRLPTLSGLSHKHLFTGKISCIFDGNAKRRIFAIINYFAQVILRPLHLWLAKLLRRLEMDGTFDQTKPINRLKGKGGVIYSIDLKSATDRFPFIFQLSFLAKIIRYSVYIDVLQTFFKRTIFKAPIIRDPKKVLFYGAGQPMGAYSSWPLFALSHHALVWLVADRVYPRKIFKDYALLGDDLVIADEAVAREYMTVLQQLDIPISLAKSFISPNGLIEFAKRIRSYKMSKDLSPLSVKKTLGVYNLLGWFEFCLAQPFRKYRVSTLFRLGGVGFRAASRPLLSSKHKRKVSRYKALILKELLPFDIWFMTIMGYIYEAEAVGRAIDTIRSLLRPVDIQLPPPELLIHVPGFDDNLCEVAITRLRMKGFLKYLKWYSLEVLSLDFCPWNVKIPSYAKGWLNLNEDENPKFRFGLHFRLVKLIHRFKGQVRCLPLSSLVNECFNSKEGKVLIVGLNFSVEFYKEYSIIIDFLVKDDLTLDLQSINLP